MKVTRSEVVGDVWIELEGKEEETVGEGRGGL